MHCATREMEEYAPFGQQQGNRHRQALESSSSRPRPPDGMRLRVRRVQPPLASPATLPAHSRAFLRRAMTLICTCLSCAEPPPTSCEDGLRAFACSGRAPALRAAPCISPIARVRATCDTRSRRSCLSRTRCPSTRQHRSPRLSCMPRSSSPFQRVPLPCPPLSPPSLRIPCLYTIPADDPDISIPTAANAVPPDGPHVHPRAQRTSHSLMSPRTTMAQQAFQHPTTTTEPVNAPRRCTMHPHR
ncbi:hypothetical protein C2E23DRAFT_101397 [Lenzites betulinus]|nr:hypothetical protein C2E23DRAFT_101397 [Lenzites betulinus]